MRLRIWQNTAVLGAGIALVLCAASRADVPGDRPSPDSRRGAGEISLGTVLAAPAGDYDFILGVNAPRELRVRVLHRSRFAAGTFHTEILTLSVSRLDTGAAPRALFLPTNEAGEPHPIYAELNHRDSLLQKLAITVGAGHAAMVQVAQTDPGRFVPGRTRFFLAPEAGVAALQAANPDDRLRPVHRQQMALGPFHVAAALVALDSTEPFPLKVPSLALAGDLLRMNPNVEPGEEIREGQTRVPTVLIKAAELAW